jgi:hypothetical protein
VLEIENFYMAFIVYFGEVLQLVHACHQILQLWELTHLQSL